MEWRNAHTGSTVEEIVCAKSGLSVDELLSPAYTSPKEIENLLDAAKLIWSAVKAKMKITIFGDYDADGITSTTILVKLIRSLGGNVSYRLPRRLSEGFGLSINAVNEIDSGLLITVDNGVSAINEVQAARNKGLKVIVLDHHLPEEGALPNANILVDPHIHPDKNGFEDYCGAGLSLKLAELFVKPGNFLDELTVYAAIGTIADVMPLVGDNRRIVKRGLDLLSHKKEILGMGLRILLNEGKLASTITESDIGFKIGPMLNAPGRMEDDGALKAVDLLLCEKPDEARLRTNYIINTNEARKNAVAYAVDSAKRAIEADCLFGMVPLVLYLPDVPEGIVGIVTGKLTEEFNCPCFVFTSSHADPDVYKGSGRSYGGVNLKTELVDPVAGIVIRGGGHAGAAGITVHKDRYVEMVEVMCEQLSGYESKEADCIVYDMECTENDVPAICAELERFAPYGEGNPSPIFCIRNATLSPRAGAHYKLLGANSEHLKLLGKDFSAICFGMTERYKDMGFPLTVNIVGTLSKNYFQFASENQMEAMDLERAKVATRATSLLEALRKNGTI